MDDIDDGSALDDYAPQLAGRMLALETLVTLLLRAEPRPGPIIAAARARIDQLETAERAAGVPAAARQACVTFAAARASLDSIGRNTG